MAAWLSKFFKSPPKFDESEEVSAAAAPGYEDLVEEAPKERRVIQPEVLGGDDAESWTGASDEVRIKAKLDDEAGMLVFLLDRPLLEGRSFFAGDRAAAAERAPLAELLLEDEQVRSVLIHNATLTVHPAAQGPEAGLEPLARALAPRIRGHLQSGAPVVHPHVLEGLPGEETIRAKLQQVIDEEINPGVAAHSGHIALERVEGNTAYITMGGGCQGCAAASITLRSGIEQAFRNAVPQLGGVLDATDHSSGKNPYFNEIPAGMRN